MYNYFHSGEPTVILKNSRLQIVPVEVMRHGVKCYRCTYMVNEPGRCRLLSLTHENLSHTLYSGSIVFTPYFNIILLHTCNITHLYKI